MEVPLNSPRPLESIARLADTVMSEVQVAEAVTAGAKLVVSPDTDTKVIARAGDLRLDCLPGFLSATGAFAALAAGATWLNLFPAASVGTGYLKALGDVPPTKVSVWAVGNEVLQFFLIVFGFAPLVPIGLKDVGGWHGLVSGLHAVARQQGLEPSAWLSTWGVMGSPRSRPELS